MMHMYGICFRRHFMIEIYSKKIDKKIYYKLLAFLLKKCNIVAFAIPNYKTVFPFNNYKTILTDYNRIKFQLERDNQQYKEYIRNIDYLLKKIDNQLIKKYIGNQYFDQLYAYEIETHIYNYNDDVIEIFKEVDGLYKWLYPNYPEDLYFFSNGKCYFASISHEKECCFFDDSEEIIDLVESLNLDYYISPTTNIPLL